jgi:uncharacterized protein YxeA
MPQQRLTLHAPTDFFNVLTFDVLLDTKKDIPDSQYALYDTEINVHSSNEHLVQVYGTVIKQFFFNRSKLHARDISVFTDEEKALALAMDRLQVQLEHQQRELDRLNDLKAELRQALHRKRVSHSSTHTNKSLKHFHVSVYEDKGDKDSLDFYCQAECEEGADEQALKSYPNGEIRHTIEVSPNEYPLK